MSSSTATKRGGTRKAITLSSSLVSSSSSQVPSTTRKSRRRRKPIASSSASATNTSLTSGNPVLDDFSDDSTYNASLQQRTPIVSSSFSSTSTTRSTSSSIRIRPSSASSSSSSSTKSASSSCTKSLSIQANSKDSDRNNNNEVTNDKENQINYSNLSHRRAVHQQEQGMVSAYDVFLQDTRTIQKYQSEKEVESQIRFPSESILKTIFNASFTGYPKLLSFERTKIMIDSSIQDDDDVFIVNASKSQTMNDQQMNIIINLSRQCIRAVVSTHKNTKKMNTSNHRTNDNSQKGGSKSSSLMIAFAQLRLAIHCIKAILPTICSVIEPKPGLMKQVIMLLYHLISVVEDIYTTYNEKEKINISEGREGNNANNGSSFLMDILMLSLSCYQILGVTLKALYGKGGIDDDILLVEREGGKGNSHDICDFFPVPCITSKRCKLNNSGITRPDTSKNDDDLRNKQTVKIVVHIIITTSVTLWNVYHQQMKDQMMKGGDVSEKIHDLSLTITAKHINQFGRNFCFFVEKILNSSKIDRRDIEKTSTNMLKDGEDVKRLFCLPFQSLLCQIAIPWIVQLMSILQKDDDRATRDDCYSICQSFVSRITKLLFESATELDKFTASDESLSSQVVSVQSLQLRQDSIMSSLLFGKDLNGQWISNWTLLTKSNIQHANNNQWKQFERASWHASNFSTNFASQMDENKRPISTIALSQFHQVVGAAVDTIARDFEETSSCYIEYCAQRALHTNSDILREKKYHNPACNFSHLPFPYSHSKENCCQRDSEQLPHAIPDALVSLYYLTVMTKNIIMKRHSAVRSKEEYSKYLCLAENIIQVFRRTALRIEHCAEEKSLLTCQRTLSKLKLISFVVDVIKKAKGGKQTFDSVGLFVVGRILGECFSPLNYLISKKANHDKHEFLKIAVECYLRAGYVLDTAVYSLDGISEDEDENFVKDCFSNSDRYISKCGTLSCNAVSGSENPYLESIAKSICIIGKQRIERKHQAWSLLPFTIQLDIFTHLFTSTPNSKLQLPARYSYFASILTSLEMNREACIAHCRSVIYSLQEVDKDNSNVPQISFCDILLFCDEYISGKIKRTLIDRSCLSSSILKIVRLYLSIVSSESGEWIAENKTIFLQSRLGSAILKASEWKGQNYLAYIIKELISIESCKTNILVHEMLQILGVAASKLVKRCAPFQRDFHNSMIQVVKRFRTYSVEDVSALCIASASTTNILAKDERFDQCGSQVMFYIDRAYDEIHSYIQNDSCDLQRKVILLAYEASIKLLKVKYNPRTKVPSEILQDHYKEVMESCMAAIHLFSTNRTEWKDVLPNNVVNSLKWTISTVFQNYYAENLTLVGAENMALLYDFLASHGRAILGIEGIVGSLLLKGEQTEKMSYLVSLLDGIRHNNRERESLLDRIQSLAHNKSNYSLDELAQSILCQIVEIESYSGIHNSVQELEEMFATFQSEFTVDLSTKDSNDRGKTTFSVVLYWWLSSCQMALAHGYDNIGELERALFCTRCCVDFCKLGLKAASEQEVNTIALHELCQNNASTVFISLTAFTEPFRSRIYDCYELMAQMYCHLGDHKRAKIYIISSGENLGVFPRNMPLSNSGTITDILRILSPNICTIRHMVMRNTMISIFSLTNQGSDNIHELKSMFVEEVSTVMSNGTVSVNNLDWLREASRYFILLKKGIQFGDEDDLFHKTGMSLLDAFCKLSSLETPAVNLHVDSNELVKSSFERNFLATQCPSKWKSFCNTLSEITLLIADCVLKEKEQNDYDRDIVTQFLEILVPNNLVSSKCRAKMSYLVGHHYLKLARDTGELQSIWTDNSFVAFPSDLSNDHSTCAGISKNISKARHYFSIAASLVGPATSLLSRQALRCLALTIGDHVTEFGSVGEIIHSSIGSSVRQTISRMYSSAEGNYACSDSESIFRAYDININDFGRRKENLENMYKQGREVIPSHWNFVAMTLCPTGELLISSLFPDYDSPGDVKFKYQTFCVFPERSNEFYESTQLVNDMMKPFDELVDRSNKQLAGIDQTDAERYNNDKNAKAEWWQEREDIDRQLESLLQCIEFRYFNAECVRDTFLLDDCNSSDDLLLSGGNLSAKFEAACVLDDKLSQTNESKESLQKLTVKQLKQRLQELDIQAKEFRNLRKAALIDFLLSKLEAESKSNMKIEQEETFDMNDENLDDQRCIFLVLDEHLCRFPFEGLPLLKGRTVCRIPSFPFAISSLYSSQRDEVQINPRFTKFVLDPESNLFGTQKRLEPVLKNIPESNGWEWRGKVGEIPSESFMNSALTQENGIFLYYGHSGGQRCYSRNQIETLMTHQANGSVRQCRSSLVLMGCSSGALLSVNQQNGHAMDTDMHFEPEGLALSYLCAGAPCVVSNLWDVTDRDIDRYSIALLERFFKFAPPPGKDETSTTLAQIVATSRDVCRMKYIVGCAPVVYGIPVSMAKAS